MARKSDFETGASIFALGAVLTIGSYVFAGARGGGAYLVCYGPMFFGLLRMGRGLLSRGQRAQEIAKQVYDPRWSAAPDEQVGGLKCSQCAHKIVIAAEGVRCNTCTIAMHTGDCQKKHADAAHPATA